MTDNKKKPIKRVSEPTIVLDKQIRWTYCRKIAENYYYSNLSTPRIKVVLESQLNLENYFD